MGNSKNRIYGIDAFRCLAAFLVVMVHCVTPSRLWSGIPTGSSEEFVMHFFWLLSLCCVNCFAVITGYIGGTKRHRFSSYLSLYGQVLFYLVLIYLLKDPGRLTGRGMMLREWFPITGGYYWYFTSYTVVVIFLPLLQLAATKLSQFEFKSLLIGSIFVFVIPSMFPWGECSYLGSNEGFSAIWLIILYLFGAYIRKYPPKTNKLYFLACAGSLLIPLFGCFLYRCYYYWGWAVLLDRIYIKSLADVALYDVRNGEWSVMHYTHPLIFLETICLLITFTRLKLQKIGPWIKHLAPYAFGVYLVHCNETFRTKCMVPLIKWAEEKNGILYPLAFLLIIFAIFMISIFVDFIRDKVFLYSGISRLVNWIGRKSEYCGKKLHRLCKKL